MLLYLIFSTALPDPCTTRNTGELISHPFFCDKFYQCVHGTGIIQSCQKGTWFDSKLKVCSLRPKGAECTLKYKMQNSTLSSSTTTISTTLTTNAMLTSPSTSAKSASPLNTPFLSEANNSSPDAAIKPKKISTDEEGNTPRHHNSNNFGAQLNHIPWKSTTQNPFEGKNSDITFCFSNTKLNGNNHICLPIRRASTNFTRIFCG